MRFLKVSIVNFLVVRRVCLRAGLNLLMAFCAVLVYQNTSLILMVFSLVSLRARLTQL